MYVTLSSLHYWTDLYEIQFEDRLDLDEGYRLFFIAITELVDKYFLKL